MYINAQHERAMVLLKEGDPANALEALQPLFNTHAHHPDLWHDRAVVLYHLKRLRESLSDMNKAQELQPGYGYRYASRAYIRDSMGDIKGAIADYQIAIELDPDDAISVNNLGLLQEKLGHTQKARMFFELADEMTKRQGIAGGKDSESAPRPVNLQQEIDKEKRSKPDMLAVVKQTLTTKEGLKELVTFISNGFRIKTD